MAGYLTTHVLDTARGRPATGLTVELYRIEEGTPVLLRAVQTNADGRTDDPILPEAEFRPGLYELNFHAGAYLTPHFSPPETPFFLDEVPVRFGMAEPVHYHVPLLLSPYGYSTYRGS